MIKITPAAKKIFINYINSHPKAKRHEIKCSGIKNITENIDGYFKIELLEKDHADVVRMIRENNGTFSKKIMERWIVENYIENYIKEEIGCD